METIERERERWGMEGEKERRKESSKQKGKGRSVGKVVLHIGIDRFDQVFAVKLRI